MSFIDKIKPFAGAVLGMVPGVAPFVPLINAALTAAGKPELSENATGQDAIEAYQSADPETQKRLDGLEMARIQSYTDITIAQENNKASTRPEVVLKMANLFVEYAKASFLFLSLAMVLDAYLVHSDQEAFLFAIAMDGMPWLAATYALPAMSIIQDYFARRSQDKRANRGLSEPEGGASLVELATRIFKRK